MGDGLMLFVSLFSGGVDWVPMVPGSPPAGEGFRGCDQDHVPGSPLPCGIMVGDFYCKHRGPNLDGLSFTVYKVM